VTRATARDAVATWIAPPNVAGLNTVFTSWPKLIEGADFTADQPPGTASGTVAVVHIVHEDEQRIAFGGEHGGWKRVTYTITVQLFHRSLEPDAADAQDHLDAVVDALKERIRADRTLGSPDVWQAAEESFTGDYGVPDLSNDAIETWASISFALTEMLPT